MTQSKRSIIGLNTPEDIAQLALECGQSPPFVIIVTDPGGFLIALRAVGEKGEEMLPLAESEIDPSGQPVHLLVIDQLGKLTHHTLSCMRAQ